MTEQPHTTQHTEIPEGFENDLAKEVVTSGKSTYPVDTLMIRTEARTVHDVLRRVSRGDYILHPDFQRDFVWDDKKQSKLIESVLMRIPLPVFYFAENKDGKHVVVDGLQRITTFQNFVEKKLRLKLPDNAELDKKRFEDLETKLQNRIEDCNLTMYLIDAEVGERIRLDIFERVNAGVPLTRQQMRNCLYSGPATAFLKEQAKTELFLEATGRSLNEKEMRDREFITRFCAFYLFGYMDYRGDMDDFLARALTRMNKMPQQEMQMLEAAFVKSMNANDEMFQRHAFRRFSTFEQHRSVLNASLWDVMSTVFVPYDTELILSKKDEIVSAMWILFEDNDFIEAITISTNDTRKVAYRFERVMKAMQEILG